MEWLNVVVTPLMAFLGVVVSSVVVFKTKKLELADKDKKDIVNIVNNVLTVWKICRKNRQNFLSLFPNFRTTLTACLICPSA